MLRVLLKITRGAFTVFVLGLCHPHSFNGRRLNAAEKAKESQEDHKTALMALEQKLYDQLEGSAGTQEVLVVVPEEPGNSQGIYSIVFHGTSE